MRGRRGTALLGAAVAAAVGLATAQPTPDERSAPTAFEAGDDRPCNTFQSLMPTHPVRVDGLFGPRLGLRVHVLLDVPESAREVVERALRDGAATAYGTARIDVHLTWGHASVPGTGRIEAADAIKLAKQATGGTPPGGADIVYLLTDNDLTALGTNGVAGMADCVGGISNPSQAYAVGEVSWGDFESRPTLWGIRWGLIGNTTAKIFAHEVGHLVGAHHHYANCVEGVPSEIIREAGSVCTLMFNDVGLASLAFSQANAAVARGHVARWGNAN